MKVPDLAFKLLDAFEHVVNGADIMQRYSPKFLSRVIDAIAVLRSEPNADMTIGYARGIRDTLPAKSNIYRMGHDNGYMEGYGEGVADGREIAFTLDDEVEA